MRQFPEESIAAKYLVNTHMMAKVVAFHPETQTVDVIQEVYDYVNTTDGDFVVQNEFGVDVTANVKVLDIIYDIPVKQTRYGQFSVRCCPKEGDTGYIEIFTEDLQDWFKNGGPSVPWAALRFMRRNSVFVPFVPNKKNCATDYPTTNDSLIIKSKRIEVKLTDPESGNESVSVSMSNGVSLVISADGSITASCNTATVNAEGSATINAQGGATINAPDTTITGNTTINGTLQVDGAVTAGSTMDVTGAVTCAAVTAAGALAGGSLAITGGGSASVDGDITGNGSISAASVTETTTGVSLGTHTHAFTYSAGPTAGAQGTTEVPTP